MLVPSRAKFKASLSKVDVDIIDQEDFILNLFFEF